MKTWFTINNGKVDRIQLGNNPVGEGDWKVAPDNWGGNHGDKYPDWFDAKGMRILDEKLVELGKRIDNRGKVYNTKDQSSRLIYGLDEELALDETKEAPLENEPYQNWDGVKKKWVIDTKTKERSKKEARLAKMKGDVEEAEKRSIRPMRAMVQGKASDRDKKTFAECNELIDELRPQISELEKELKTA
jgi:uncharacterized protein YukE